MQIFENKEWPGFYLMKDGTVSLLLEYRNSSSKKNECPNAEIDMCDWIEIIVPKN